MLLKFLAYIFLSLVLLGNGEFKEVAPLDNGIFWQEQSEVQLEKTFKEIDNKEDKKIENDEQKNVNEIVVSKDILVEQEIIQNNSVPVITEEQLLKIIAIAKEAPPPENTINSERKNFYPIPLKKEINQPQIIQELEKTLEKYNFIDKSEEIFGGKVTTKELTSDHFIDNLEFGVGVAYKNNETYSEDFQGQNSDIWTHTPIYATGKYNLSKGEESNKYLKINFGYAIGDEGENREYNEINRQSGIYYGVGGGVEYHNISLDLMYQVNKDANRRENSSQDDSRITFSVDYKLGI